MTMMNCVLVHCWCSQKVIVPRGIQQAPATNAHAVQRMCKDCFFAQCQKRLLIPRQVEAIDYRERYWDVVWRGHHY